MVAELCNMEKELAKHYSESLFKNIWKFKFEIHDIFNKKAEHALFRRKTTFYESGEKTGRLLARQLKKLCSRNSSDKIRGSLVTSVQVHY